MHSFRFVCFTAMCLGLLLSPLAHADDFVWTGEAGNGTWTDPANWTNTTPGGTATFPDGDDNVTFNTDATTTNGAAENVSIANAAELMLKAGNLSFGPGTITNNGLLTYEGDTGTSTNERLLINNSVTLSGTGELVLVEETDSYISKHDTYVGTDTATPDLLTNAAGHTIRGAGTIEVDLVNQSDIFVESGELTFSQDVDNTAGIIHLTSTGELEIGSSATITGGELRGTAGGLLEVSNGTLAEVVITRKLFAAILARIEQLALPPPSINGG